MIRWTLETPIKAEDFTPGRQPYDEEALRRLSAVYAQDVVFSDPIYTLKGLDELRQGHLDFIHRFEIAMTTSEAAQSGSRIFLPWTMVCRHRRWGWTITIDGVSVFDCNDHGQIIAQRDHWDLLKTLAEANPLAKALREKAIALLS